MFKLQRETETETETEREYIQRETERKQYTDYIESENIAKNGQENPEKSGNFII